MPAVVVNACAHSPTASPNRWHPQASIFAGAGTTENGALFSYQANWEAPGRWSVEILTKKHRLIFKPLEKLLMQKIGSVETEFLTIDDELDTEFKPGLYEQTKRFYERKVSDLCDVSEHVINLGFYEKIIKRIH